MSPDVTAADVERFRRIVAERAGLWFDDPKLDDLAGVLRTRLRARGRSAAAYLSSIDEAEVATLAERLTVGETFFFRYREHFDALSKDVVPELRSRGPLRILSAGCATGEEPYSIVMELREHAPSLSFEVHAFDLNPAAIARARSGRYSQWALREMRPDVRKRHFTEHAGQLELAAAIRASVTFESRNLLREDARFWHEDAFDIVFCRNVIMYFEAETMRAVVSRIARSMRPGGFLFLGHAETLRGLSAEFCVRQSRETFYYERAGGDAPVVKPARASTPSPPPPRPARVALPAAPVASAAPVALVGVEPNDLARAVALTNEGRLAEAESVCRDLLATGPHAGAHYLLALCREHAGDRDGALEQDRVATEIDPGFVMPHVHAGILERRAGRYESAAAAVRRALDALVTEDEARLVMFAGGFSRESLVLLCRRELERCKARA